jgi:NDP-sugar pyrophosphorylase family protein
MVATLTHLQGVSLFVAEGAQQKYRILESPLKANQILIQRPDQETPVACLEGTIPKGLEFQAYASRGGDVGVLHSEKGLVYFLLPGATVEGQGFKLTMFGETLPQSSVAAPKQALASKQSYTTQAMILGAGLGTRILPLTEDYLSLAKPALPWVGDSTVIGSLVEVLAQQGIQRIYVNTFYQRASVQKALDEACAKHGVTWIEIPEERPTGTAGGVLHILNHLDDFADFNPQEPLLILQGDAITNADLAELVNVHHAEKAMATIGCQIVADEEVSKFGIVATRPIQLDDPSGRIHQFLEKPSLAQAGANRLASTGFYVLSPALYPYLQGWYGHRLEQAQKEALAQNKPKPTMLKEFDFAQDVFNHCLEEALPLYAYKVEGFWCDIGNPAQYVETLSLAYQGFLGVALPQNIEQYYDAKGVFYWSETCALAQEEALHLAGGVVVARKV